MRRQIVIVVAIKNNVFDSLLKGLNHYCYVVRRRSYRRCYCRLEYPPHSRGRMLLPPAAIFCRRILTNLQRSKPQRNTSLILINAKSHLSKVHSGCTEMAHSFTVIVLVSRRCVDVCVAPVAQNGVQNRLFGAEVRGMLNSLAFWVTFYLEIVLRHLNLSKIP